MTDDDAGAAFDRAAARAARRQHGIASMAWIHRRRYRAAVQRFVLVAALVPAHAVAVRRVTLLLVLHLVVVAYLASGLVGAWLRRDDTMPGGAG